MKKSPTLQVLSYYLLLNIYPISMHLYLGNNDCIILLIYSILQYHTITLLPCYLVTLLHRLLVTPSHRYIVTPLPCYIIISFYSIGFIFSINPFSFNSLVLILQRARCNAATRRLQRCNLRVAGKTERLKLNLYLFFKQLKRINSELFHFT